MFIRRLFPVAAPLLLLACTQPVPLPPPVPAPPSPPAPLPAQENADWRDWPVTPGLWSYLQANPSRGSSAYFGQGPSAVFAVRCDPGTRSVLLDIAGAMAGSMLTITTTTATVNYPLVANGSRTIARLSPQDRTLDAMAFSRGRIVLTASGIRLVIPSWPEFARVVEDCRG